MTQARPAGDYRHTVFLPETGFPMRANLAETEPRILARWAGEDAHATLRRLRAGAPRYILHDGPPYANGHMHLGHALNHVLKDLVVRSRSMMGFDSPYVPGWDCHGLPIEWRVEEQNRAEGRSKRDIPVLALRAQCRAYAAHWVEVQREELQRLGIWGAWDRPYLTMDFEAEAAIAAEFLKFVDLGLVYRGAKPVLWSPVEQTALAEAEVEYEEIVSTQVYVAFPLDRVPAAPDLAGAAALVWTTTPWTLPVNRAIAFAPDIDYALVRLDGAGAAGRADGPPGRLLVAEALLEAVAARLARPLVAERRVPGSALAGARARHPLAALHPVFAEPRPLLAGDFVSTDQGTGLVHLAPDHGEDDFRLCRAHGIDPLLAVGPDGTFRADWPLVGGQHVFRVNDPDGPVVAALRAQGALLAASADWRHSYPHSWRSKKKLIYRCTPQWFVAMDRDLGDGTTLRTRALSAIGRTRWIPAQSENRIRAMVDGRPDWVLSRQRAWGVPLPLFVHRETGRILRDPAVDARILDAFRAEGADAWWAREAQWFLGRDHAAADYEQVRDILDVWFDSGTTFAFVTEARLGAEAADLYLEGSDQHRGWFQSSLLAAAATRGRAPYRAVYTHGMTLDERGRKMSKSLGNVVDPARLLADSGADVLRLWVASTDTTEDQRIGPRALQTATEAYRKLRNTLRYLLGALNGFGTAERVPVASMPALERWTLSRLAALDPELDRHLEEFAFARYTQALLDLAVRDLSAFVFDVRKDCLYCDAPSDPRRRAYRTMLAHLFDWLVTRLAPVLVFTAEEAWGHRGRAGSVHHALFARADPAWRDPALEARMGRLRALRALVTAAIEPLRREKVIGSSLEAEVVLETDPETASILDPQAFAELCLVASVLVRSGTSGDRATAGPTNRPRCARCWRHLPDVSAETGLCTRCEAAVRTLGAKAA